MTDSWTDAKNRLEVYADDDTSPPTVRILLPSEVNLSAWEAVCFARAILDVAKEVQ